MCLYSSFFGVYILFACVAERWLPSRVLTYFLGSKRLNEVWNPFHIQQCCMGWSACMHRMSGLRLSGSLSGCSRKSLIPSHPVTACSSLGLNRLHSLVTCSSPGRMPGLDGQVLLSRTLRSQSNSPSNERRFFIVVNPILEELLCVDWCEPCIWLLGNWSITSHGLCLQSLVWFLPWRVFEWCQDSRWCALETRLLSKVWLSGPGVAETGLRVQTVHHTWVRGHTESPCFAHNVPGLFKSASLCCFLFGLLQHFQSVCSVLHTVWPPHSFYRTENTSHPSRT